MQWRLAFFVPGLLCGAAAAIAQPDALPGDPSQAVIVTGDIPRFWAAFDAAGPEVDPAAFDELYLRPGSPGIEGFTQNRIRDAENLARMVRAKHDYYASIRGQSYRVADMEDAIRAALVRLEAIYPDAVFPPVYFVIGAMNSGGTTSRDGLIIGVELYGRTPDTPMEELTDWDRAVLGRIDDLPYIVSHELIHYQQQYGANTLLGRSLREGSADFLGELISGRHINVHVHDWADPREAELWAEFRSRLDDESVEGWLYSSSPGRPNDLGYWMGYRITRAYYDKAPDKAAAVRDILSIDDPHEFLDRSGYAAHFEDR